MEFLSRPTVKGLIILLKQIRKPYSKISLVSSLKLKLWRNDIKGVFLVSEYRLKMIGSFIRIVLKSIKKQNKANSPEPSGDWGVCSSGVKCDQNVNSQSRDRGQKWWRCLPTPFPVHLPAIFPVELCHCHDLARTVELSSFSYDCVFCFLDCFPLSWLFFLLLWALRSQTESFHTLKQLCKMPLNSVFHVDKSVS